MNRSAPRSSVRRTCGGVGSSLTSRVLRGILGGSPIFFRGLMISLLLGVNCNRFERSTKEAASPAGSKNVSNVVGRSELNLSGVTVRTGECSGSGGVNTPLLRDFINTLVNGNIAGNMFVAASSFAGNTVSCTDGRSVVLVSNSGLTSLVVRFGIKAFADRACRVGHISDSCFGLNRWVFLSCRFPVNVFCVTLVCRYVLRYNVCLGVSG